MSLPKKVKKDINAYPTKTLLDRRQEMLEQITNQDTNLPESVMHEDLDLGMLEFVKEHLTFNTDGNPVNFVDKILSLQRWAELSSTWEFTDKEEKIQIPFIVVVRKPEVPYGSNPALMYTIPDRQTFFYRKVSTWDGNRLGADIYKIPQPVPVDLSFEVVVVCNRMRELNSFNKKVMQKFSSRQAYTVVKGHYIPIVLSSIADQSQIDAIEGRRFYQQTYSFQMQGFLMDEEEFEVVPAVDRQMVMIESSFSPSKGSAVKIEKIIKSNIEVETNTFVGDGTTTTFKVQKKINTLFYVEINGLVQRLGVDYIHNGTSSNIIFLTPPPKDSVVRVTYTYDTDFTTNDNKVLTVSNQSFDFDDTTLEFNTDFPIDSIILLDVGGLLQLEVDYYTYEKGTTKIVVNEIPPIQGSNGVKMSVVYLRTI